MALPRLALVLVLVTGVGLLRAEDQDLGELQRAAEAYARSLTTGLPGRVDVTVAPLDPRTRLSRCESLQTFVPPGVKLWGGSSVGLRCLKPDSWTLYVPVTVKVTADVVVTTRAVRRGQTLSPEDVRLETMDLTQLPADVLTDLEQAVGKATHAAFPASFALREDMLREPLAVIAGQRVRIVFQGDGFTVSSEGKSLGNASVGEPVQVRAASGKLLSGVVQAPGVVHVQ